MPSLAALASYRFEGRNEAAVREDWIRPLLDHLGYGIESLNEIQYETSVVLREPIRLLGSHRFRVDYLPTVLHRGLWLIEAKAPAEGSDWTRHLGQAWSYATHPEVNVPLMALADGSRVAVYDVTRTDWDVPVVDIPTPDLDARFSELIEVLGARSVSEFVRRRHLDRLRIALRAEIDPAVLDETVAEVRAIVEESRPVVAENRRLIRRHQMELDESELLRIDKSSGIWGIAQHYNGPLGLSAADIERAVRAVLYESPEGRPREFESFFEAAKHPSDQSLRAWWSLRSLRLAVALRVRHEEGCSDFAEEAIRTSVRDHLLGFPADPISRAAHDLERPLPVVLAKLISGPEFVDLPAIERLAQDTFDEERLIRRPVTAPILAQSHVVMGARRIWNSLDWDADSLSESAGIFRQLSEALPDPPHHRSLFGFLFDPLTLAWDDLVIYTIIFLNDYGSARDIPEDAWSTVTSYLRSPGTVGTSAASLLSARIA
jgi:Type I restriction enzyme R protein N terminus (HSDR_N)